MSNTEQMEKFHPSSPGKTGFHGSYVDQQKPNFIKDPIITPPQIQLSQMDNRSEE